MSQFYVPGPCQIFAGVGTAGALVFLGYSQSGVRIRLRASFRDVIADYHGPDIPAESQYMGEEAYFSMTLSKYNESVLQAIAARRYSSTGSVTPGSTEANGIGSLMIAEGGAYQVLMYAPYGTKAFQSATIVPGYLFQKCWLNDEFETPISIMVKEPQLVFRAIPLSNSTLLTDQLYTNTLPAIPAIN